ncbi:uncharacterized protein LOC132055995 isoform X1 [Lycium ferocissimum]|uniref:uncharacterized protein LOC132055995 isoform X1 n=1 Tax=Lycium ferocissimum TaxID=112874 RepID=UPI002814EF34|nr:uncharacterized protein LOC132055995 isoform X1 [Lycium ferocissimum]
MAELCLMSETVEEIVKKPRISCSNSVDLTLRLPDHILHSIFSYLTSQDLVNVHLVSKNWHRNTPSYFAFNFDESLFLENVPYTPLRIIHETHNKFLDWIRSSLETSKSKLNKADKRVLRILFYFHQNIYDIMRLMDENDFHEVYLRFEYFHYSLPYIFQLKSTCLTVLHLTACTLDEHVFHDEAKFASLQEVKLDDVRVSGKTLSKFISKCPNIRELSLEGCKFLHFIVLPKLDRLEKLYVNNPHIHHPISNIQVVALSLQVFHLAYCNSIKVAVRMNIRACRMLRELHLDCRKFPEGLDHEHFCSDFPHLETLYLGPCETLKRVKISSSSLRNLTLMFTQLYNYNYSRKSVVWAPNLCYFHYVGRTFKSSLAPSDTPKLLEKNCISLVPHIEKINRAWFLQLRSHLKKISNHIGLVLVIREEKTSFSDLGKRGHKLWSIPIGRAPTQLLPHIKRLKLDIRLKVPEESHRCLMKYIIDNLLLMSNQMH